MPLPRTAYICFSSACRFTFTSVFQAFGCPRCGCSVRVVVRPVVTPWSGRGR